ncbi:MAG TPA: hypothetical protein DHN29_14160 [Cytophagales bacterium]|nr:hypothetical protein [Cytophagales bacterium]
MFNVGDKLVCVSGWGNMLTIGKIYEVVSVSNCTDRFIRVVCDTGHYETGWDANNFIPYDDKDLHLFVKNGCL